MSRITSMITISDRLLIMISLIDAVVIAIVKTIIIIIRSSSTGI